MHLVLSLKDSKGKNLFADPADPLGLSLTARHFMAGILNHMKEMTLLTNPTVNSYARGHPGWRCPGLYCLVAFKQQKLPDPHSVSGRRRD